MSNNQIKQKGRRLGSKNKPGSKAPGPKPAHLINQTFLMLLKAAPLQETNPRHHLIQRYRKNFNLRITRKAMITKTRR